MVDERNPAGSPPCAGQDALSDRGRARRDAIVEAARELFLEKGYASTTLAEVVARSGGSLSTLYALFGNKRGLFEAILRDFADEILAPLCVEGVSSDPERGLTAVGRRYLTAVLEPRAVAWWRTVCAEAPNVPELSDVLLGEEGGPVQRALAAYLARLDQNRRLEVPDPELAAGQFLDLVRGPLHRHALACGAREVTAAEIERQVAGAIQVFLHGYHVRTGGARSRSSDDESSRRTP